MPLITIQSSSLFSSLLSGPIGQQVITDMLSDIRISGAEALKCSRSNIWVMFESVPKQNYLQGEDSELLSSDHMPPPIVVIRAQAGRSREEKESLVRAVAQEVSKALSVPFEKVWIHYQELDPRDVWFKGKWER
jgi:phenylpyruvate tautomerase PptA (4-oxalocrotonate tautomerase family)